LPKPTTPVALHAGDTRPSGRSETGEGSTNEQYVEDAEQAGGQELADFFREVQQRDRETGERAKSLLQARLPQSG
jgi:hypothetical protein